MERGLFLQFIFLVALIAGCSTSRERAEWIDVPEEVLEAAVSDAKDDPHFNFAESLPQDWWRLFNDEQLTYFIELALFQNPSLLKARDLIFAESYEADRIRGLLYPQLTWEADIQRQKLSKTGVIPFQAGPIGNPANAPVTPAIPVYFTQYETALDFAYNLDIWGRRRDAVAAACSEMHAAQADEAYRRLALSILLAETYFKLQIAFQREAIAVALEENLKKQKEMVQLRVMHHLEDEANVYDAEVNILKAEEARVRLQGVIHGLRHLLLSLIGGNFQEEVDRVCIEKVDLPAVPIPCSLPLHLISSRPDIMAQLWIIGSFAYRIDVAEKAFYPDFNLVGFIGYQTIHWKKLFNPNSIYGDIEPAVTLPLFRGGALVADLRGSEVNYDIAIHEYNELVLQAVKEVLDGMTDLQTAGQVYDMAKNQKVKQQEVLELMELKEKRNLASHWDVLNKEAAVLSAEDHRIEVLQKTFEATLALIKALGGGYEDDCCSTE